MSLLDNYDVAHALKIPEFLMSQLPVPGSFSSVLSQFEYQLSSLSVTASVEI